MSKIVRSIAVQALKFMRKKEKQKISSQQRLFFQRELEELKDAHTAICECMKIVDGDFDVKLVGEELPGNVVVNDQEFLVLSSVVYGARLRALVDLQKTIENIILVRIEECNKKINGKDNLVGCV
jgi:hypothetical protein